MHRFSQLMRWLAAAVATWLVIVPAGAARAATAQRVIATLNKQRAANGLPAAITEDPQLTQDCAAHDRYMALNSTLTHVETPGTPGYSPGGAFAGRNSVLAYGVNWNQGNPYENAPLHLDELLAPRLSVLGSADVNGYSCTTVFPGWIGPDPPGPTVYTYPGNGATIYSGEVAQELPWTPGQLVGIPQSTRTGPNLLVFAEAPTQSPLDHAATINQATVTGPAGAIAIKVVDGNTPVPAGAGATLAPYISPGGFIIPVSPLTPGATYRAHVMVTFAGFQIVHDWSFTAAGSDPKSTLSVRGTVLSFSSLSRRSILVTFTRAGGQTAPNITILPGHRVHAHLDPGSWQACGHQAKGGAYAGYDHCLSILVTGTPMLRLGAPRVAAGHVRFSLRYASVLRGRRARLVVTPLSSHCTGGRCHFISARPVPRTIVLRGSSLALALPRRGNGLKVDLSTAAFQLADAPWTAARTSIRFIRT